jgi:hypothetical protein
MNNEYFLLISCKSMQEKQAFEMTPPKELHQADREWVGGATPLFEKEADHLRDRFLPKQDSTDIEKEKPEPGNLLKEQVGDRATDSLRAQVGAWPTNLCPEQVDKNKVDLLTEQVDAGPTDLLSEQVDEWPADLYSEQVDERAADLYSEQVDARPADLYSEQVDAGPADLFTEQVEPLKSLSKTQWRIVAICEVPRTLAEIMAEFGLSNRGNFKVRHLDPLIKSNLIRMTNPGKPRAANQKYVLTETGIRLKINRPKGKS